jgi:hypothetical protein
LITLSLGAAVFFGYRPICIQLRADRHLEIGIGQ